MLTVYYYTFMAKLFKGRSFTFFPNVPIVLMTVDCDSFLENILPQVSLTEVNERCIYAQMLGAVTHIIGGCRV